MQFDPDSILPRSIRPVEGTIYHQYCFFWHCLAVTMITGKPHET